jgi:hypothetical protein
MNSIHPLGFNNYSLSKLRMQLNLLAAAKESDLQMLCVS